MARNIRCKATASRTDVLLKSINSFRSHRQATRERRKTPLAKLNLIKSRARDGMVCGSGPPSRSGAPTIHAARLFQDDVRSIVRL
jgi:hypothetical protein